MKELNITIQGEPGSGKTTALNVVVEALVAAGYKVSKLDDGFFVGGSLLGCHGTHTHEAIVSTTEGDKVPTLQGIDPDVVLALNAEFAHQDAKHGAGRAQSLPGYLHVMELELAEAKTGWCKNLTGRSSALHEVVQTVAVGLRCLQDYGTVGSAESTRDRRQDQALR